MSASATFTAADGTTTTRKYAHGWTAGDAARKALREGRAVRVHYVDHSRSRHYEIRYNDIGNIVGRSWREPTS